MRMVEWKKIEYVCSVITGGDAPLDCVKGQLSPTTTHPYPVFSNGDGVYGYCPSYRIAKDAVTVSSIGNVGSVNYRLAFFTPIIRLKVLVPNNDLLLTKFLYYALMDVKFIGTNSSLSSMKAADIKKIQIPVPSLAEQTRIVNILDTFTASIENLKQQIAQRRKQYEHYRDQLLDLEGKEGVEMKTLGEVGTFIRGSGIQKSDFVDDGFGCIHYGQIHTKYGLSATKTISKVIESLYKKSKKAVKGDVVLATTSEDAEGVAKPVAWLGDESIAVSGDAYIFHHDQNGKFMAYQFASHRFCLFKIAHATGAKVVRISGDSMAKFAFPLPSIEEQQRIVSILDTFEACIANLEQQLAQRERQYEYYRNKLLTFE
jgi:type I restriction enzyme S subunit